MRLKIALVTIILTFTAINAVGDSHLPIPVKNTKPFGKSYNQWSADWLKWALAIPVASNPILDKTGEFSGVGQSGKVWFLAGTTGNGAVPPVIRNIRISTGTALFFPIVNSFWVNTPDYGDPIWSLDQEQVARQAAADVVDTASGLKLQIDGHSIRNLNDYRVRSNVAQCSIPPLAEDNIFGVVLTNSPYYCVADGYWVMLPPLSAGLHTIKFTGGFERNSFSLDVTYKIKVQSNNRKHTDFHLHD